MLKGINPKVEKRTIFYYLIRLSNIIASIITQILLDDQPGGHGVPLPFTARIVTCIIFYHQ